MDQVIENDWGTKSSIGLGVTGTIHEDHQVRGLVWRVLRGDVDAISTLGPRINLARVEFARGEFSLGDP